MEPTHTNYPFFEANQVLSNTHLNQGFDYLHEQERLTRANLIGIGIVCGLEIRLSVDNAKTTIQLSKGCGVTSEGYLIVEPENLSLVSYRADYMVPNELAYPTFSDNAKQYPLWELFPDGEPNATLLGSDIGFLNDKAVLLFLELKKQGLRNCSLNNCDDKGAEFTATVKRLLIKQPDLATIIAKANQLEAGLTTNDIETALLKRLQLPDLRLPRYDVPTTNPATTDAVLKAFLAALHTDNLATETGKALNQAYEAFKPLVEGTYPNNPFDDFTAKFGFLDNASTSVPTETQVKFLQYYYDFFDDLLKAYDEFRWKGAELMCACCPPEGLFPRHLMLGVLSPASVTNPNVYRHQFLASAATSGCEERTKELEQLFQRLVEMITRFTEDPPLLDAPTTANTDVQIRITPSKLGNVPLSDKAIPYYYLQSGTPPLFQLWSAEKTRRNRANQNLSYRSDGYEPAAPAFVTNALQYDLEPYNFLRIEGHLGKNYQRVLNTLISIKTRFRLPIEIIALRTGTFNEIFQVDLSKEACRFQDLETLYDTLKAELSCFLCKGVQFFYDVSLSTDNSTTTAEARPKLPWLAQCAPDFMVKPNTLGWLFEACLSPEGVLPDIDQNFYEKVGDGNWLHLILIIVNISKLFDQLSQDLGQLDFESFEKHYQELAGLITEVMESQSELEAIFYNCRLDAFKALQTEYKRRIKEVKQKQFLSFFLQKNPGIQHKAGVPLGGTFILVYHENPTQTPRLTFSASTINVLSEVLERLQSKTALLDDPDIQLIFGELTGQIPKLSFSPGIFRLS